jgi:hypothetical protein
MAKVRIKSPIILAFEAIGGSLSSLPGIYRDCNRQAWVVKTPFGPGVVEEGDWVTVEADGTNNVLGPEEFAKMYELV